MAKEKKKIGRPPGFTKEIGDKICLELSTSSKSLKTICKQIPISPSVILDELAKRGEFTNQYARAKEEQADFLAEEILELADKERKTEESITNEKGGTSTVEKDNYNRTRLQIEARKWLAMKLKPKKYGDKLDVTSDGEKLTTYSIGFKRPDDEGKTND